MTTGQLIKAARKRAGLTQKELGAKMGQSFQSVAQWENDLRNPKIETLQRIAAALGVDAYSLMDFDQASQAIEEDSQDGSKYKAQVVEIMDKITTEGVRIGRDVFKAIAGNPKYQLADIDDETFSILQQQREDTPAPEGSEGPQEGEE